MATLIEKAEKEYKKHRAKYLRLKNQLSKAVSDEQRLKIENSLEIGLHQVTKSYMVLLGRRMEQAGRDLANAAKQVHDTPGDLEIIISTFNTIPKDKSFEEKFKIEDLKKEINKISIEIAVDSIKNIFSDIHDVFPDQDDDDDDDEDEDEPEPGPLTPKVTAAV